MKNIITIDKENITQNKFFYHLFSNKDEMEKQMSNGELKTIIIDVSYELYYKLIHFKNYEANNYNTLIYGNIQVWFIIDLNKSSYEYTFRD